MGSPFGNETTDLTRFIESEAPNAGFLEVMRLLELWDLHHNSQGNSLIEALDGEGPDANRQLRFRPRISLSFPTGAVSHVKFLAPSGSQTAVEVGVQFAGLVGTVGTLPRHYTRSIIHALLRKDNAMAEFFELFTHRLFAQFYRATIKYRLPASAQRSWISSTGRGVKQNAVDVRRESISKFLSCLTGQTIGVAPNRFVFSDTLPLFFSGAFARVQKSVGSLAHLLAHYLANQVNILEFCGQWLYLQKGDQTRFVSSGEQGESECQLGVNCIAGNRVWDIQSKIRIQIGPTGYEELTNLLPNGKLFRGLCELTRLFLGVEIDFDVEIILRTGQAKGAQMTQSPMGPYLGWNTWAFSVPLDRQETVLFASNSFA